MRLCLIQETILIQELKDRADNPEGKCIVHGYVPVERVKELLKDDGYNDIPCRLQDHNHPLIQ